jgi:cytochrome bd-type quinol oxidase subunit 2
MKVNQKIIVYSLSAFLVATGIVYFMVANGEYQDFKELIDLGIKGETAEKQFEMTFFIVCGIIYLGLVVWVLKLGKTKKYPFIASMIVSAVLIVIYVASRTIGVPIVGTEYYIGKLDILSKVFQAIVIGLSGLAIYDTSRLSIIKKINK